jgi:polysaccharide biosynthesis protein PslG
MSSRSPRRLVLPGLGLIVLGTLALSACAAGTDSSNAARQEPASVDAPLAIGAPATAAVQAAGAHTPKATHSLTPSEKAKASASAHGTTSGSSSGAGTTQGNAAKPVTLPAAAAVGGSSGVVYGFSDPALLSDSASVQVQQLQQMKAMGITSVRVDASWYWGQPSQSGGYEWASLDQVVASLQQVGMTADFDIDQTPSWAATSGASGNMWAAPDSASAYAAYAGAVAARYGGKGVNYFEIWNEPNLSAFWAPAPDAADYTAILKAAYAAIKAADPSAIVLSGGLAPAGNTSTSVDPLTFLQDMYSDGAEGSFDGLGDHPYSFPTAPDDVESSSAWSQMSQTSPSLRSIMDANGDSAKKIWITEYGAPTSGPNSIGESGQSTELTQAISLVRNDSWVGSFYIYTWADISGLDAEDNGYGLLNEDNSQKPAYSAVTAALSTAG